MAQKASKMRPSAPSLSRWGPYLQKQAQGLARCLAKLKPDSPRRRIHEARVLTRRLRAALAVLCRAGLAKQLVPLRKSLKKLGRELGPVRSLDVTLQRLKELLAKLTPKQRGALNFTRSVLQAKRKAARSSLKLVAHRKKILRQLKKLKLDRLSKSLAPGAILASLERRSGEEAGELLIHREDFTRTGALTSLHQVRIHLKKWRYLQEIRNDLVGPAHRLSLEKVKALQDELGAIHDLQILCEELGSKEMRERAKTAPSRQALDAWKKRLTQEIHRRGARFQKTADRVLFTYLTTRFA